MIFSELYSAYYNTVAAVLAEAVSHPLSDRELAKTVERNAFGESMLNIPPALKEERWQLIKADGTTPIKHRPSMPMTLLQRRWLKAISLDPRIRLFGDFDFGDVEPLFRPEDILIFDKYNDGDNYEDPTYIANFRLILDALRNRYPLNIETKTRNGDSIHRTIMPESLEYSQKDDKFRLIGSGSRFGNTVNLGRIISISPAESKQARGFGRLNPPRPRSVQFELTDRRNALERVLMHFAHFKKQAERLSEDTYRITVYYDKEDETELVIRILSFGPHIRVTAPDSFISLIKQRLTKQMTCGNKSNS